MPDRRSRAPTPWPTCRIRARSRRSIAASLAPTRATLPMPRRAPAKPPPERLRPSVAQNAACARIESQGSVRSAQLPAVRAPTPRWPPTKRAAPHTVSQQPMMPAHPGATSSPRDRPRRTACRPRPGLRTRRLGVRVPSSAQRPPSVRSTGGGSAYPARSPDPPQSRQGRQRLLADLQGATPARPSSALRWWSASLQEREQCPSGKCLAARPPRGCSRRRGQRGQRRHLFRSAGSSLRYSWVYGIPKWNI